MSNEKSDEILFALFDVIAELISECRKVDLFQDKMDGWEKRVRELRAVLVRMQGGGSA